LESAVEPSRLQASRVALAFASFAWILRTVNDWQPFCKLFPLGAFLSDDAKAVVRCWQVAHEQRCNLSVINRLLHS
jgi:hypothetical protein